MARLIVKAPYIKSSGGGYLKYIGTRDGVELLPQSEIYMQYINERPRSHGLFGDEKSVDLKSAIAEVECYTGNIWTPIISLRRDDAVKFGYDNAGAWRNLLRAHRNEIAEAFKISPDNFRWYAAFHDEGMAIFLIPKRSPTEWVRFGEKEWSRAAKLWRKPLSAEAER